MFTGNMANYPWCHNQHGSAVLLLLSFLLVISESLSSQHKVLIARSPNSTYLMQGEPLELNVTLNISDYSTLFCHRFRGRLYVLWYFRRFSSTSFEQVLRRKVYTYRDPYRYSDSKLSVRYSFVGNASLLLLNTTFNDSGTYKFYIECYYYPRQTLQFNVTIIEKPQAEITCSSNITLKEAQDFSCWCKASGSNRFSHGKAVWFRNGRTLGDPLQFRKELFLENVSQKYTGTYICRAQLYNIMDEKTVEIVVNYFPRIITFHYQVLSKNSMKLICVADGFPKPNYLIKDSNGKRISGFNNGEVTIGNFLNINITFYSCEARSSLGKDLRRLNIEYFSRHKDNHIYELQTRESASTKSQWYYFIITFVGGLVFGVVLITLILKIIRRRKATSAQKTKEIGESTGVAEDSMTMTFSNPVKKSVVIPGTSSDYQDLDEVREPDHTYMGLNMTSRMKTAASAQR